MTPSKTPFAGFERLAPGDALSSDGYSFQDQNPLIADQVAKIGCVTHRHDAHAAMADPTLAPTLAVLATGGTLPSGETIYVQYTLTDGQGGESAPVDVSHVVTPAGYADPTGAPTVVVNYTAGSLLASTPMYAISVTDGLGGETALGPPVAVTIDSTPSGLARVLLSGLTALTNASSGGASTAGWRLWRSEDGGNDWDLMSTGPHSTDTWTDDGTVAGDCSVSPLTVGTTGDTGVLHVTVPTGQPSESTFFSIYACTDGPFISPCRLGTYPVADLGVVQTFTALAVQAGSPPAVSRCYPGANQIDPDTDILNWSWKQPVANFAALPSSGNTDGDVRETLDTHLLYVWDAGTSTWITEGGTGGSTLGSRTDFVQSDAGTGIACDGSTHSFGVRMATPPAWLDTSGNILSPGLYAIGVYVSHNTNPTTTGLLAAIEGAFYTNGLIGIDLMSSPTFAGQGFEETVALGAGDVPVSADMAIVVPTDATGVVEVRAFIIRLAH
jgi:hypothetical protein